MNSWKSWISNTIAASAALALIGLGASPALALSMSTDSGSEPYGDSVQLEKDGPEFTPEIKSDNVVPDYTKSDGGPSGDGGKWSPTGDYSKTSNKNPWDGKPNHPDKPVVPEPTSALLIGLGLAGLAAGRRRLS